jgi:hypothetical protein
MASCKHILSFAKTLKLQNISGQIFNIFQPIKVRRNMKCNFITYNCCNDNEVQYHSNQNNGIQRHTSDNHGQLGRYCGMLTEVLKNNYNAPTVNNIYLLSSTCKVSSSCSIQLCALHVLKEENGFTSQAKPSQAKPSQSNPSQAKLLTGGGDLREAHVNVPLSVSHTYV